MIALAQQSNILDFPTVAPQGKSSEWYTPSRYIEAARTVMGSIDLDPASCEMANRTVKAARYYTEQEDGLAQEWHGNVWLNPPYGRKSPSTTTTFGGGKSVTGMFTDKLIREYKAKHVEQAIILLLGNSCFNIYFIPLWEHLICFYNGNVFFTRVDGSQGNFGFGTIFVYLGPNEQRFIDIFSQFGTIAKRVSQPRHTVASPSLWEVAQ